MNAMIRVKRKLYCKTLSVTCPCFNLCIFWSKSRRKH